MDKKQEKEPQKTRKEYKCRIRYGRTEVLSRPVS